MKDKKLIALLAACVLLAAIAGKLVIDSNNRNNAATTDSSSATEPAKVAGLHEDYTDLPDENVVVQESASNIIERYENGTGIIFLGFKECPWCQELLPLANEAASAEGEKVYYLDIKKARESNSEEYQKLVSILSPHLAKDANGQPRIMVPDVSLVRNGEIVWRHENESVTEEEKTPETYWTEERKTRAIQEFRDQIQVIKKGDQNEGI